LLSLPYKSLAYFIGRMEKLGEVDKMGIHSKICGPSSGRDGMAFHSERPKSDLCFEALIEIN